MQESETTEENNPSLRTAAKQDSQKSFYDSLDTLVMIIILILIFSLPFLFTAVPKIIDRLTNGPEDHFTKQLKDVPPDTKALIEEMIDVQMHTQIILKKLETDAIETEKLVEQKKKTLSELQQQNEILKLTPEQIKIVESYNKTVNKDPDGFFDWFSQKSIWYEKVLSGIVSVCTFFVGRWYQKKKKPTV